MTAPSPLRDLVARNRAGQHAGIPSYCTAHGETLRAIFRHYRDGAEPILIEATCNQVNQDGGYTGMTPKVFRDFVLALARETGLDTGRILLGGDHLGPNPWKAASSADAMGKARDLVAAYVEAGFTKIHLDASMACGDDVDMTEAEIARRAASMAAVAERLSDGNTLTYIIGTEVPKPGGETEELGGLAVTEPHSVEQTYELHRMAFLDLGLEAALSRTIGLVVQPGVDFGNNQIFGFDSGKAARLSAAVADLPGAIFEAHSTDYQSGEALSDLVAAHFAILKVGPELTAGYRAAVVAMASIEAHLPVSRKSDILQVVESVMVRDPKYWSDYIAPGPRARLERLFGLSDRIRYYWLDPEIQKALSLLSANIDAAAGEVGLVEQFGGLPGTGALADIPLSRQIIQARVGAVVEKYRSACSTMA